MSMIPIKKINNPAGLGKCYPLSVFESIVTTAPLTIANDIGGYKKGDIIPAETRFSTIFHNMFEIERTETFIITTFDNVSDSTVASSKLTYDSLSNISQLLSGKENIGVAKILVDELKDGIVTEHTLEIIKINEELELKSNKKYVDNEFNNIKSDIFVNSSDIFDLKKNKQDKLVWASQEYDANSNKAVTISDIYSTETNLRKEFVKITTFKGVIEKRDTETDIQAIKRFYQEKEWIEKNGDAVFVGKNEYIYCTYDTSWHELGNSDGYIKSGTGALTNNDFNISSKISQDYIVGLKDIQENVTTFSNDISYLKNQVENHDQKITNNTNAFNNYIPRTEIERTIIPNIISETKNYTDNQISNLKFSDNDSADLTSNNGIVCAIKNILIKLGMKESNIRI